MSLAGVRVARVVLLSLFLLMPLVCAQAQQQAAPAQDVTTQTAVVTQQAPTPVDTHALLKLGDRSTKIANVLDAIQTNVSPVVFFAMIVPFLMIVGMVKLIMLAFGGIIAMLGYPVLPINYVIGIITDFGTPFFAMMLIFYKAFQNLIITDSWP
eukprot:c18579_g1_i1.p1 GENE.c18579_g1_i1~~c18579_g1_i1.p1  ORF type:complete len:173 (+),score=39.19 c18579_g1_i1:58-519(+)